MAAGDDNIVHIPVRWPFNQRASFNDVRGPTSSDEMVVKDDQFTWVRPRPSYVPDFSIPEQSQGAPGGITMLAGFTYGVIDQNFVQLAGGPTGADGVSWSTASASAPWVDRKYFDVVNFNNTLFLIGGQTANSSSFAQADVWSSKDGGVTWGQVTASAPFGARFGHRCVVFNGAIYLMGGWYTGFGGVPANDVWMTQDGANWTQINGGAAWGVRVFFGAVATAGGIYVMGGTTLPTLTVGGAGTNYNDVWFSADGITWTLVSPTAGAAWSARCAFDVTWNGSAMILLGGENANTLTKNNECWTSPNGNVWTQVNAAALSIGNNVGVRLCTYGGNVYALGGWSQTFATDTTRVYKSTDSGVTWALVGNMPSGRTYGGVCVGPVSKAQSDGRFQSIFYVGGGLLLGAGFSNSWNATLDVTFTFAALTGAVVDDFYQFETIKAGTCLLIKSIHGLWIFEGGVVTPVNDARYPSETVPGIVVMGGYAYVMDPTGLLVNCDFNNPQYWPGANFVGADYSGDGGVAIAKRSNYLIAFGPSSTQWFYDAGTPVGSPLLPYLAANSRAGCLDGTSIVCIDDNLFWYGVDEAGRRGICTFNGSKAQVVSNDAINRLLAAYAGQRAGLPNTAVAMGLSSQTHAYYVYPLDGFPPGSVVFDVTAAEWYLWTSGNTLLWPLSCTAFPFACSTGVNPSSLADAPSSGATCYMLPIDSSRVYYLDENGSQDQWETFPATIPTIVLTGIQDAGNNRYKAWGRLDLICDQLNSTDSTQSINVTVTDDDYISFSPGRGFDVTTQRPALFGWGSSRKRAYRLQWSASAGLVRVRALEQEYTQGS